MKKFVYTVLLVLCIIFSVAGQEITPVPDQLTEAEQRILDGSVPITFGLKNDGYPDRVKVSGVIKRINSGLISIMCGVTCYSAIVEIELDKEIKGYIPKKIYVAVSCPQNYLKKGDKIELKADKIYKLSDRPCESIVNTTEMGDIPAYRARSKSILFNANAENEPNKQLPY